jgi:uncharacterized membrane protein
MVDDVAAIITGRSRTALERLGHNRAMELWQGLKYLHILAVITAVGANLTYAFWLARAGRDPVRMVFVIESIQRLDQRVANPAYIVAALAGIGIVLTGPFGFDAPWIATAIALYVVVAVLGIVFYAPALRRQLDLAGSAPDGATYGAAARRSQLLGLVMIVIVFVIVALMVFKPSLWAG